MNSDAMEQPQSEQSYSWSWSDRHALLVLAASQCMVLALLMGPTWQLPFLHVLASFGIIVGCLSSQPKAFVPPLVLPIVGAASDASNIASVLVLVMVNIAVIVFEWRVRRSCRLTGESALFHTILVLSASSVSWLFMNHAPQ